MKKTRNMEPDAKLGAGEILAYGLGGGGANLVSALVTSYILLYYTMVVGVEVVVATGVIAASKLLDGVSDLVMGYVIDHTKSKKGKAKPWYFRFIIPTVICLILTFSMPHSLGRTGQLIYIFITYNLISTVCYTVIGVAFTALNGLMTTNQTSRGLNGGLLMLFNTVISLLVTSTILKLTRIFGGGDVYSQTGWTITIVIYAVLYVVLALICHFFTYERVIQTDPNETAGDKSIRSVTGEKIGLGRMLSSLVKNKFWVIAILVGVTIMMFMGISSTTTLYFAEFVLGNVDIQASLLSLQAASMLPALIISIVLLPKLGKRNLMLIGMSVNLLGCLMPMVSLSHIVLHAACVIKGVGYGIAAAPMGSLVQDTVTYGHWKNGFINVGMGNAANTFAMKIGNSLGTVLTGFLLSLSGFVEKSLVQSQSTQQMISFMYIWVPAIAAVICIVLLIFYTLDKLYPTIEADLKEGRYAPGVQKNEE